MKTALILVFALFVGLVAAHLVLSQAFLTRVSGLVRRIEAGPAPVVRDLPEAVRAIALAAGADPIDLPRALRLTQDAELKMGDTWTPVPATQTVALGVSGFAWFAETPGWPLPKFRVVDAFVDGEGLLEARALGSVRVAHATGPLADRGEAMRYLAELPWAPDAILGNPDLDWRVEPDGWIEVALDVGGERVSARFRPEGTDVVEMRGMRPDTGPDGAPILRQWQGHFSGHAEIGDRRIPLEGEVGYVTDGIYEPYWKGRVTGYDLLR